MRIILLPYSLFKMYLIGAINGVSNEILLNKYLSSIDLNRIEELNSEILIGVNLPRKYEYIQKQWCSLSEDDLILYFEDNKICYYSKILLLTVNSELSNNLWSTSDFQSIYIEKEGDGIKLPLDLTPLDYQGDLNIPILLDRIKTETLINYLRKTYPITASLFPPKQKKEPQQIKLKPKPKPKSVDYYFLFFSINQPNTRISKDSNNYTILNSYLSSTDFQKLNELNSDIDITVYGVSGINLRHIKKLTACWESDRDVFVLFYSDDRKCFYYVGKLLLKIKNGELAKQLWGYFEGELTWEYIFILGQGKEINIAYAKSINSAYLTTNAGTIKIKKYLEKCRIDLSDFGIKKRKNTSFDLNGGNNFLQIKSQEKIEKKIKSLSGDLTKKPVKTRISTANKLVRNSVITNLVKERARYICEICGAPPFTQKNGRPYAEAHHIFELAVSRLDSPHQMICVCPTCHRVIEYGSDEALEERKKLKVNTNSPKAI